MTSKNIHPLYLTPLFVEDDYYGDKAAARRRKDAMDEEILWACGDVTPEVEAKWAADNARRDAEAERVRAEWADIPF